MYGELVKPAPPPGYRWTGRGQEIELIDPAACPGGHPWRGGQRGYTPCAEHHGHPTWSCECGRKVYGSGSTFFERLECR